MKRVNGSQAVPLSACSTCLQAHQKLKDYEAARSASLKRHIFPLLHWMRTPWCNLPLLSLPNLWISLSGAVCPKFFSIKTRCNLNQQQQQKFEILFDFCTPNSRGGGGGRGGKKSTRIKYPYEEITTSKCNSLVHIFLRKQFSSIWLWACSQHLLQKNWDIQK